MKRKEELPDFRKIDRPGFPSGKSVQAYIFRPDYQSCVFMADLQVPVCVRPVFLINERRVLM